MKFLPVSIILEKNGSENPQAISGFPNYADLCESSIATQVDHVSSANSAI